jgi:hypothetical protein
MRQHLQYLLHGSWAVLMLMTPVYVSVHLACELPALHL